MASNKKETLERVKKDIRSVLITESGGMGLESFIKVFRQLTNGNIPFRWLGYQSLEELLLDAREVCRCERLPTGELHLRPVCDESTSHVLKMVERSRKPRSGALPRPGGRGGGRGSGRCGTRREDAERRRMPGCVPIETRKTILELLRHNPQGIFLDEFNRKHKDMFSHAITFFDLGFYSIRGMLESIGHLVRLKETPAGDKVFPIPAPDGDHHSSVSDARASSAPERPSDRPPSVQTAVPAAGASGTQPPASAYISYEDSVSDLKRNLLSILTEQKSAVKLPDILDLYRRRFGCNLDFIEYGFTSLLCAVASLGPPFHLEKHSTAEGRPMEWFVSLKKGGENKYEAGDGTVTESPGGVYDPGETSDDGGTPLPLLPAAPSVPDRPPRFTVDPLRWIEDGQQVLTETGYPLLEVVVTHVRSPGQFFFCLSSSLSELWRLDAAMAAVYGSAAGRRLQPTDRQLTLGRPLAVRGQRGWRRGLLVGRVAEQVKVHLVDTGATLLLPLDFVQILHEQFMDAPILSHEGTLANIVPKHGVWSDAALRLFRGLVADDAFLMATVLRQSEYVSSVLLCDTRSETDLHVADQLLESDLAEIAADLPDTYPAPLVTPRHRHLDTVYRLLDARQPPPADQRRVPPEGEEPPETAAAAGNSPAESVCGTRGGQCGMQGGVEDQINALKAQCYDTLRESQTVTSVPKRAALQAKLRRLESQLKQLELDH